jgi:4-hydroxybenzoyl-CoA reductase beta subunit
VQLPGFDYLQPRDLDEALDLLGEHGDGCAVLAGGTDLLVRMKQRLKTPARLVSLKHLRELNYIRESDGWVRIGAATPLARIIDTDVVRHKLPAFHTAMAAVGARSIQHVRGTLGGNLCQENRCRFYNQSAFFRSTRQACHKAGGTICYAREGSDRCRSTCQSDGAPALMALAAEATLRGAGSQRTIPLQELYTAVGDAPLALHSSELLTEVAIPLPAAGTGSAYRRLTFRAAIDYPIVSAAACVRIEAQAIAAARIVVGAIGSAPLFLVTASNGLKDKSIADEQALSAAAEMAGSSAGAFVVDNVNADMAYRTAMIPVLVSRALQAAIANAGF